MLLIIHLCSAAFKQTHNKCMLQTSELLFWWTPRGHSGSDSHRELLGITQAAAPPHVCASDNTICMVKAKCLARRVRDKFNREKPDERVRQSFTSPSSQKVTGSSTNLRKLRKREKHVCTRLQNLSKFDHFNAVLMTGRKKCWVADRSCMWTHRTSAGFV